MNILMSSINYNIAKLEDREKFSFTNAAMAEIYEKISAYEDILGCVIISTCNRTEIYLSVADSVCLNPFAILCDCIALDVEDYKKMYISKNNYQAALHICEVACGLKSQIWGEDQIISQVKNALSLARECNATDSILEVLFRNAISAAKKVKTLVEFKNYEDNASKRAANIVKSSFPQGNALVIGNGAAGRSICEFLLAQGIAVTMTKRKYKHSNNVIPAGADSIDYAERYEYLSHVDAVISATLSPHHTIKYDEIINLDKLPKLFIDMAVPRDIDPRIEQLAGVAYYNIDDISRDEINTMHEIQMVQINKILKKYIDDFYNWYSYKMNRMGVS